MENEQTFQKKTHGLTKESSNYMSLKHMKSLIVLVVGFLAVGCGKSDVERLEEENKKLSDNVLGEYEVGKYEDYGDTHKYVLLENGILEWYVNGKKTRELKWKIVKEEIHVKYDSGWIDVYRINQDKSITLIGKIKDGKRTDYPKEKQEAWRKIK